VSSPIFPSILIAKNQLTGSLKNRSIDNLETQKKSISMKNYLQGSENGRVVTIDLRRSSIGKLTSSVPWLVPRLD
jgi:hypothetical protein